MGLGLGKYLRLGAGGVANTKTNITSSDFGTIIEYTLLLTMTIWLDQCPRALRTRPPQVGKWGRNHGVVEAPSSWRLVTEADQGAVSGHAPSGVAPTEGAEICRDVAASSTLPVVERLCKKLQFLLKLGDLFLTEEVH